MQGRLFIKINSVLRETDDNLHGNGRYRIVPDLAAMIWKLTLVPYMKLAATKATDRTLAEWA